MFHNRGDHGGLLAEVPISVSVEPNNPLSSAYNHDPKNTPMPAYRSRLDEIYFHIKNKRLNQVFRLYPP
jgi:hypothetical protein